MKIEVTAKELWNVGMNNAIEREPFRTNDGTHVAIGPDDSSIDITDLVTEQLKVKVPDEMPWNVYYEFLKASETIPTIGDLFHAARFENDDEHDEKTDLIGDWIYDHDFDTYGDDSLERELIIARAMQYGFKLAERKFRVHFKGIDQENSYLNWNKQRNYFVVANKNPYGERFQIVFIESELKGLNAPDWIMNMPREYVEE